MLIFSKVFFILCFLLVGFSCQSTLDVAGDEHKTVTEKWRALSTYAESNIDNYGVTVTARLAITAENKFKLTHYQISKDPSRQDIDLLAPNFEYKYICLPVCYQLIEYVNFSGEDGNTLLTNYFDRHEFELFKFYGDIQLLNKQLAKLANYDQRLLKSYLTSLAYQSTIFETAKEFTQFLTAALTPAALEGFSDNPEELFSHFLKNYQVINGGQWPGVSNEEDKWASVSKEHNEWTDDSKEQDEWADVSKEQNEWADDSKEQDEWADVSKEQNEWSVSTESPELAWSTKLTVLPEALWLKATPAQKYSADGLESTDNNTSDTNQLSWQSAKVSPIIIGHNVCSYKESYFGVVVAISFEQVIVNLLGQAKIINEGVVYPASAGDLFTLNENLYFSPITEKRTFERSDVASCILE